MCETCRLKSKSKISGMKKRVKKSGRKMYRRRARVSGLDTKSILPLVLGVLATGAGAYVAGKLNAIDALNANKTQLAAVQMAAGVALGAFVPNDYAKYAGVGMAVAGLNNIVKEQKILSETGEGIFGIPVRTGIAATPEYYGAAPDYSSATMSIEAM